MSGKYWIETYGCQMNVAETASLELALKGGGWSPAETEDQADLVVLNTCSVRKTAENRIWGRLGYYKSRKGSREFLLGVMGCMTERLKEEIRGEVPAVDILIGTFGKGDFVQALLEGRARRGDDFLGGGEYSFAGRHSGEGSFQAMVPIMHGCNNFCTYCIVPHVRGREVSRDPGEILRELRELEASGIREVTLLGQNVNSYRFSRETGMIRFPELLEMIVKETGLPWIRFVSSHPKDFSGELIRVIRDNPRICRHIHLPVQHGSSKILAAMNRKYTREEYLALVERIRAEIPGISLTTDILLGFPGETEEDFLQTMDLVTRVGFEDAFTYQYNAIEGTAAFSLEGQIPSAEKKRRPSQLIELQRGIGSRAKEGAVGRIVTALVEGVSRRSSRKMLARTEQNHMVVFEGTPDLTGQLCPVRLVSLKGNTFQGERICPGN